MKKAILIIPFLVMINTSIYSVQVESENEERSNPEHRTPSAEEIQIKIDTLTKYLNSLPIEIQNTIGELTKYKEDGLRAEKMVKNLVVTLDKCATRELDEMAQLACSSISNGSVSRTIKVYKVQIKDAIAFVNRRLIELRKKEKNTDIINDSIKSLENARDILLRKV